MGVRTLFVAVGAAVTAFLVVAVTVIERLPVEFSALVGLPVGVLAGLAVLVGLLTGHGAASDPVRRLAAGAAGFGYGVLSAVGANYVNLADLGVETTLTVGIAAAVVAVLATVLTDRRETGTAT